MRVVAFGTLAQYQLYRRTDHSFYISDDRPTLVGIEDSLGEEARVAAHEKTDVHVAPLPGRRRFTVVRLLENDIRIPLYGPDRPDRNVVELLAELNVDCWVSTRIPKHEGAIALALSYTQLAVYWLWQMQPAAGQLYEAAARRGQFCVRLDLEVGPEFE